MNNEIRELLERCALIIAELRENTESIIANNHPRPAPYQADIDEADSVLGELKACLEKPVQESDIYIALSQDKEHIRYWTKSKEDAERFAIRERAPITPFYTSPQSANRNTQGLHDLVLALTTGQPIWPNNWGQDVAFVAHFITQMRVIKNPASIDMSQEEFAKIAYEAAAEFRRDRFIADKRIEEAAELHCQFYELGSDKKEAWIHGCAVALAEYKKAAGRLLDCVEHNGVPE